MTDEEVKLFHFGHEVAELKGRTAVELERILNLLSDAKDAVEIEEPGVAVRRIASSEKAIQAIINSLRTPASR